MHEAHEFTEEFSRWYKRPFPIEYEPCDQSPSLSELIGSVCSGRPLSEDQQIHVNTCPRCQGTLAAIEPSERLGSSRHLYHHRRWPAVAGLATAAVLVISFFAIRHAFAFDPREAGYARPIPTIALVPPGTAIMTPSDSQWIAETVNEIATCRARLEEARATGDDPWQSWVPIYRNLRALGRWDEALTEMHAFVEFARGEDEKAGRYTMYYSGVYDLGQTYAALGEYDKAWGYHEQSLALASDYLDRMLGDQQTQSADSVGAVASTLIPRLGALSTLAAAKDEMRSAWDYHNQATELLADYFRRVCNERGLNVNPSAPLVELCMAAFKNGGVPESPVVKVREHMLREARLHRLDRNLDAAEQALDSAKDVLDYPHADESRLDFNEPMEWIRIKIARGEFQAALDFAEQAEQHTGPRKFECCPSHAPIGIVARAELQYLKGVAKAGLNKRDPEALRLVNEAIQVVQAIASSLPSDSERNFLGTFAMWQEVVRALD